MYAKTFERSEVENLKELGLKILEIGPTWKPLHKRPCACAGCQPPIQESKDNRRYWMTDNFDDIETLQKAKNFGFEVWEYNFSINRMQKV